MQEEKEQEEEDQLRNQVGGSHFVRLPGGLVSGRGQVMLQGWQGAPGYLPGGVLQGDRVMAGRKGRGKGIKRGGKGGRIGRRG